MDLTRIRKFENAHIILWLLKDLCWVSNFKIGGVIMIVPTVIVALYLTWKARKNMLELAHNSAVCFWIGANSSWMIGEFFFKDSTKPLAQIFFALGLLVIVIYYSYSGLANRQKK